MIFITGAAGFIGSNLAQTLRHEKHQVMGLDPSAHCHTQLAKGLPYYQESVTNKRALAEIFSNNSIKTILHLGMTSSPKEASLHPLKARKSILEGTENLLHLGLKHRVKNFVFFSSSHVYGDVDTQSANEEMSGSPKSKYGQLKLQAEELCLNALNKTEISHAIIRPTSVYGPNDPGLRVINKLIDQAEQGQELHINDIHSKMDFTYIDDLINGIKLLLRGGPFQGEVFNLSRGRGRTLIEVCDILKGYYPNLKITTKENPPETQTRKGCLDITKAKRQLHFSPQIDIEEGIHKIILNKRGLR